MLLVLVKEVNTAKEYLKQLEDEMATLTVKLDNNRKVGIEYKFKQVYDALDNILKEEIKPEPEQPKYAKIDIKSGIKKVV